MAAACGPGLPRAERTGAEKGGAMQSEREAPGFFTAEGHGLRQCLCRGHFGIPQTFPRSSTHKYRTSVLWVNKCTGHRKLASAMGRGKGLEEHGDRLGGGVRKALPDAENCPE